MLLLICRVIGGRRNWSLFYSFLVKGIRRLFSELGACFSETVLGGLEGHNLSGSDVETTHLTSEFIRVMEQII